MIVAYRPKPGKETELLKLVHSRVPTLRKEGLVTDREPIIMRARDGTIIEVSEWKSQEAIDAAHKNPERPRDVGEVLRDLRLRSVQDARGSGRNVPEFRAALIRVRMSNETRELLIRQGERNDRVFRAIIGPEQFAVESQ